MPPKRRKKPPAKVPREVARMTAIDCFIEGWTWRGCDKDRPMETVKKAARACASSRMRGLEAAVAQAKKAR